MTGALMVAALWAAACYRIVLSMRSEKTVWRTAFTTCSVAVAVAGTSSVFGDQLIDARSGAWNLALLLTRLALTGAAAAASIYVLTLRCEVIPKPEVRRRLLVGSALAAVEIAAWSAAPIHHQELATTAEVNASSAAGSVFAVAFALAVIVVTTEVGYFCFSRAASRIDVTRTVSFLLTGVACVTGAILFGLGTVGVLVHQLTGRDTAEVSAFLDRTVPIVAIVLALGTLSLLVAPPVVDYLQTYRRWRLVRPLWEDLTRRQPQVRLDFRPDGDPSARLRLRLHRAIVEIHDALRLTLVAVPSPCGVREVAEALHHTGGSRLAAEVLAEIQASGAHDGDQIFALARSYRMSRSW